jgi:hypothetical protein
VRNGRLTRRRHEQQELALLHDQLRPIQLLPTQVVDIAAAWAQVVELAGPVDTANRAHRGAPASQLYPHRDADLRPDGVVEWQRLESGVQVTSHHKPTAGGVRGGENSAGHRRVPLAPPPPTHRFLGLPRGRVHGRRPVHQGDQNA